MRHLLFATCLLGIGSFLWSAGCSRHGEADLASRAGNPTTADQFRNELLSYALDNLNRLEEFDDADAMQQILMRLNPQELAKIKTDDKPEPLVAAWPQSEMMREIVDRLNQWVRAQPSPPNWKPDPMLADSLKSPNNVAWKQEFDRKDFSLFDGFALQETVWLRDISRWARGDALDDLDRVKSLFDWTVRNIQLETDHPKRIPQFPWETLFFGHGTAAERAWVFVSLVRQLGIDAVVLGIGEKPAKVEKENNLDKNAPRLWCVAVLIEGQAYLFDPTLGLPIPTSNGVTTDESGQLSVQPTTLNQIVTDKKILQQLNADATHVYGVKADDLKHVVVLIEAAPTAVTLRMKLLEAQLAGHQKMVLAVSPTTEAERWKAVAHVTDVRLWRQPFETLERRAHLDENNTRAQLAALLPFYASPSAPLRHGRVLHLKGHFVGDDGAVHYYQLARPSNEELMASSAHQIEKIILLQGKQNASYWLGLIAYQRGNYSAALDYFTKRTLFFTPNNPWTTGARYNLARTFEAGGDAEKARLQYASNDASPDYLGELLRAKWLKQVATKK